MGSSAVHVRHGNPECLSRATAQALHSVSCGNDFGQAAHIKQPFSNPDSYFSPAPHHSYGVDNTWYILLNACSFYNLKVLACQEQLRSDPIFACRPGCAGGLDNVFASGDGVDLWVWEVNVNEGSGFALGDYLFAVSNSAHSTGPQIIDCLPLVKATRQSLKSRTAIAASNLA